MNLTNLTDAQLIGLFNDGNNTQALSVLVTRHKDRIFTSIYLLVKDSHTADDMFQDLCIRIIESFQKKRYKENDKFLPWALRIAHNMCVDHFRKVKNSPPIKTSDDYDIFEMLNMSEQGVDVHIAKKESAERVQYFLDKLPYDQREVIIMRHYADMSFKEIAYLTKCSINTALGRMRYGLINLRKMSNEYKKAS